MGDARRVYGVRRHTESGQRVKFCCDFETEERFGDRFDVFPVPIGAHGFNEVVDPFLAKLVEQSETHDWELFRFRVPDREVDTEVVYSGRMHLAVFDEFESERRSIGTADSDELAAVCEGKVVARALSIEGAVAKFLNQKLGSRQ